MKTKTVHTPAQRLAKKVANRAALPPLNEIERYTVEEAAIYLRTSRVSLFKLISTGELKSIKDGKRRYIPGTEIARRSALPQTQA